MADVNQIVVTGRLVKDLESKSINESFLNTFTIAVNRSVKTNGEWKDEASFFTCKNWSRSARQQEYLQSVLQKGKQVLVVGEMVQEKWEKDGKKNYSYSINANKIVSMSAKSESSSPASSGVSMDNSFPEDVPF